MRKPCQTPLAVLVTAGWLLIAGGVHAQSAARKTGRVCDAGLFHVALDVGHTLEEPGAISARGIPEYEFNLNLAQRIEAALHAAGFTKTTLLLTGGGKQRGLVKRVAAANAARADLLISIHHDSVPDFLLQHMDAEGGPKRFSDRFSGHSIFVSQDNAEAAASLNFARLLGRRLKAGRLHYTPHYTETFMRSRRRALLDKEAGVYRFDALYVLRAARMPAVLLEAGLIINPAEEKSLAGEERPQRIAVAVAEAAKDFCAARAALRQNRRRPTVPERAGTLSPELYCHELRGFTLQEPPTPRTAVRQLCKVEKLQFIEPS